MLNTLIPKFVEPVRLVLIVVIFATLANTVLFFLSPPQNEGADVTPIRNTTESPKPAAASVNAILTRNLFGVPGETAAEAEAQVATVETRLPLELRGVFVGEVTADSSAIIAQKGKSEESYVIGDKLPGNAELAQVHPDHIVLRRAGQLETLRFPEAGKSTIVAGDNEPARTNRPAGRRRGNPQASTNRGQMQRPVRNSTTNAATNATTPRDFIDNYREKLEEDPSGTLSELGIAPVSADGSGGYRLGNLANSPYLSQTGLQPGDIVLSVNGAPVGNIQKDRSQIDSVLQQGSARLEVQRGTRRFFVTASLK